MNTYLLTLIWGISVFVLVFIINFFFTYKLPYSRIRRKKKKKRNKDVSEYIGISYLVIKYNLDLTKVNITRIFLACSFINAFIISLVFIIIYLIPWNMVFSMLLGFVLLFGLIYALYELYGRYIVKKGWVKDV